jgi:5'(3')-deoxyribonucleotidase
MLDKKKIYYFDLDQVLADFNIEPNGVERFRIEKGFFRRLRPITPNLLALKILMIKGYKVKVISASPNDSADKDKRDWLKEFAPKLKSRHIIICRNGDIKADYIKNIKKSVLFDDYGLNCRQWRNAGGTAFKVKDNRMLLRMVSQ